MQKRLSTIIFSVVLLTVMFLASSQPALAANQPKPWSGVCVASDIPNGSDVATLQGFECLIGNVFSIIITVIGMAGFIMFVIGSFRWMLSGNDSKGVETARNTMTFAIIGIVVAISGFIILTLLSSFTGINLTTFRVPGDLEEQGPPPAPSPSSATP